MSKEIKKNKSGVSLMISYVILVSIVIGLSIGVYSWLKVVSNVTPATDCKEDTSLVLDSYTCLGNIKLTLKNNGRFNVSGIILAVGNDTKREPTTYLLSEHFADTIPGYYNFNPELKPGDSREIIFSASTSAGLVSFKDITVIQIQPFIIDKNEVVVCNKAVMKQNIENCKIRN